MIKTESKGEGKEILLIHGIMSDHHFFDRLVEELCADYKLISYDRSGYGDSSCEQGQDLSIPAQTKTAREILRREASAPVWVIAHSAGGLIGLELALTCPELVCGVILVETPLALVEADRQRLSAWNEELDGFLAEKKPIKVIPAFQKYTGIEADPETGGITAGGFKRLFHNLHAFMFGERTAIRDYSLPEEVLRTLKQPVWMAVTTGKEDSIYSRCASNVAQTAGWPILAISGTHNVIEARPEEFAQYIRSII